MTNGRMDRSIHKTSCALFLAGLSATACHRPNASGPVTKPTANTATVLDVARMAADSALVLVRGDRLDAIFPAVGLNSEGCRRYANLGQAPKMRSFGWSVSYRVPSLAEAPYSGYTLISTGISVDLPEGTSVTETRLDSAFARRAVGVWISHGFPPLTDGVSQPQLVEPELRAIYFDNHRLHFVIKGMAAVRAFLALEPKRVDLKWCPSAARDSSISVPLVRLSGS